MQTKYLLSENQIPTHWYNVIPDLPGPMSPVLHPGTKQPVTPADLLPLFPMGLIEQEMSPERWVKIPDEVREIYRIWRPSPLFRAHRLEKALGTPARIYYKYEGVSPAGSHKPNTAVPQAYYNKIGGTKRIASETGAGQWGSSIALACKMFGLECTVYMVKVSFEQKPYRKSMMQLWGAEVIASPSPRTNAGRAILAQDPDSQGSLGIAISEAVEDAATREDTRYALGSVLNHVCMHQTVIGLEAKEQMKLAGDTPDVVIGCHGGGSNFAGIAFPYVADKADRVEGAAGRRRAQLLPHAHQGRLRLRLRRHRPDGPHLPHVHAGSRLHAPGHPRRRAALPRRLAAGLAARRTPGIIEARAVGQLAVFEAAVTFARTEAIIPAPESAHAIRVAIDEALQAKQEGKEKVILFNLSGHGHVDMAAYDAYFSGKLEDFEYPAEKVKESLAHLPKVEFAK